MGPDRKVGAIPKDVRIFYFHEKTRIVTIAAKRTIHGVEYGASVYRKEKNVSCSWRRKDHRHTAIARLTLGPVCIREMELLEKIERYFARIKIKELKKETEETKKRERYFRDQAYRMALRSFLFKHKTVDRGEKA